MISVTTFEGYTLKIIFLKFLLISFPSSPLFFFFNKEGKCPLTHHGCEDSPCPEGSECITDPREESYTCVCPGGNFGQCPGESLLMKHAFFKKSRFQCSLSFFSLLELKSVVKLSLS